MKSRLALVLLVGLALLPTPARAFQLTPLTAVLKPSGPEASRTFELENKSDKPTPVEVSVQNRVQDLDGKDIPDTSTAAEEKFVVYPPQFILDPKSVRSVKVTWIGPSDLSSEQAFRVNFNEISVPLEKQPKVTQPTARIDMLLNYSASVYVAPPGVNYKFTLISAGPSAKDPSQLEMIVENQGTGHQTLNGFTATLKAPGTRTFKVTEQDGKGPLGKNVLAGARLRILVPWPKDLPKGSISGEFVPKP